MDLVECIKAAELSLSDVYIPQLRHYCELLWEKNQSLNLTRHSDFEHFVNRDLVDTLALSRLLKEGEEVLDVGSGGGVPGIVLSIIRPDLQVTLCDSVGKKAKALGEICSELNLDLEVHHARAEILLQENRFDSVTARAVGPLAKMFRWFVDCWPNMTRLLAIKGPKWREERLEAEQQKLMRFLLLKVVERYPIPGEDWESVILEIRRTS